jgi:very-short-patch-repair endonuclease
MLYPYPLSILNYPVPIVGRRKKRWVDVGIPHLKVGVEYDGLKHHFSVEAKKRDKIRDVELAAMGWRIIHVNKFNWKFFMANMKAIILDKMKLPSGEAVAP